MADTFEKFTERARKVFSLAQEEAQRFNHNYIGTEHLLLGLVREGDGIAARVLANLGVQLPKVRSAVEFIIGRGDGLVREGEGIAAGVLESLGVSLEKVRQQVMQVVSQPPSYQAPPSSDPKPGSSTIICRVDLPASDYVRLRGIA
jgi:ATP-dependent Clp protease ATP-binding subunit ClpC